jgi:hypothetical protein
MLLADRVRSGGTGNRRGGHAPVTVHQLEPDSNLRDQVLLRCCEVGSGRGSESRHLPHQCRDKVNVLWFRRTPIVNWLTDTRRGATVAIPEALSQRDTATACRAAACCPARTIRTTIEPRRQAIAFSPSRIGSASSAERPAAEHAPARIAASSGGTTTPGRTSWLIRSRGCLRPRVAQCARLAHLPSSPGSPDTGRTGDAQRCR